MSESINFTLKTRTIYSSNTATDFYNVFIDTQQGSIFNMTNFVWKNINLKVLLGDLYDKYDSFNIQLSSITQGVKGSTSNSAANVLFSVKMSGLNWLSSYDQSTKQNSQQISLCTIKTVTTASAGDYIPLYGAPFYTFTKLYDTTNINIQLHQLDTDTLISYATAATLPIHYIFQFVIVGCKLSNKYNLDIANKSPVHVNKYPFN